MAEAPETARPASVAVAAQRLAENVHGSLADCAGLLVAGGEMGDLIAGHLHDAGLVRLVITARLARRAEMLARDMVCHHAPFDSLHALVADADIVISAVASGRHLITSDMVAGALAARRRKPIFLIDAAVPGDIQPGVNALDGAFVYDLDDLENMAVTARAGHGATWADPVVAALRDHFEAARQAVLGESPAAGPDEATQLLVERLLRDPAEALRGIAAQGGHDGEQVLRLVRRLLGFKGGGR
jgi:glutamyl-tRNA reductase